jgi:O-antigen/teichoic acid export membrane protein
MRSDNKTDIFNISHLQKDIKKKSLRSGAITLTSHWLKFIIMLGSTMILARLLTPDDYGMVAMVAAINGFAGLFLTLGLSTATIQRAEINHAQVSTLFWINTGIGALLMLVVAGLSPAIAEFYDTPELLWVALTMSCIFFINGLAVQHNALLNRQMRFFEISIIQVISIFSAAMVAIFFALNGYGYWALALSRITESLFIVLGTLIATRWIPGLPSRAIGVGSLLKFGTNIIGFDVVNYFSRNLDKILIGRFHGSNPLGLYNKAYQLLLFPLENIKNPLMRVALPALSQLQNDPMSYRIYYTKFLSILVFISMPLVTILFVCSDQLINIVLGPQWLEASSIFKIMAFAAFILPASSTRDLVLVSTNKTGRHLLLGTIGAAITIILFIIGSQWGVKGIAAGYTISVYLQLIIFLNFSFKNTPVNHFDFLKAIYKPFISSYIMGVLLFFLVQHSQHFNDFILVTLSFFIGIALYLFTMIVLLNSAKDIFYYYKYIKFIFSKG